MRTAVLLIALLATAVPGFAQEPQTRAEELARERVEKSKTLVPPKQSGLEKALLELESGRLFERLLNPAEGFYPKIGNVTAGSGISFGPGYRRPRLFDGRGDFQIFAAGSLKKYWMIDARLRFPSAMEEGPVFGEVHGQTYDFPREQFFGLGPDSLRSNETTFGFRNTLFGGTAGVRPVQWLSFSGGVDYMMPGIRAGDGDVPIESVFNPALVPGRFAQPDFIRYQAIADLNYREPRGNPRRGGRYTLTFEQFDDRDLDQFTFRRVKADVQQYLPLLKDRRVLALRALASISDTDEGNEVPFYFQETLGGPDDLRGFHRFRFRDRNMLLLQAEYRWEIFTAMDGAIFYDAGKVASRKEDLSLKDLESDYGIGFRFGTINGIFLRVEGAFGSSGGKHFILRFGNVF